jgi:MinD superfamily P-loop ATPase
MKEIVILSGKGGVGKSSIVASLVLRPIISECFFGNMSFG